MRDIRGKDVYDLARALRQRLDAESEIFSSNDGFRLHGMNGRLIHRLLASQRTTKGFGTAVFERSCIVWVPETRSGTRFEPSRSVDARVMRGWARRSCVLMVGLAV
jgi:hypothetical protein